MVGALDCTSSSLIWFVLGKTLYSRSASHHPDVQLVFGEFNAGG